LNIYTQKQRWKILLLIAALLIGATSLWYTNKLVKSLAEEERKKIQLWAEATKKLADITDVNADLNFLSNVISNNTTIPVIMTDSKDEMVSYRNLDSVKALDKAYVHEQIALMRSQHEPIEIALP